MTASSSRYRVVCACGREAIVGPGQAGGQLVCRGCGGMVVVPRLRDLEAVVDAAGGLPAQRWHAAQGWLVVGLCVATMAAAAAWLVPHRLAGLRPALPDDALIRAAVESVDAATAYRAWQAMRASGVDRGTLPEELRLQQATTAAGRIAAVLWTVAAIGAIAAAAGGLGWLVVRRRSAAGTPAGEAVR